MKELQSQWPLAEKVRKADHVIDNSGPLLETESQVKQLAELLKNDGMAGPEKNLDSKKWGVVELIIPLKFQY